MSAFPLALAVLAFLPGQATKSPLPGPARWELGAFDRLFRVQRTTYDETTRRARWFLATREGARTADFKRELDLRPFQFVFLDEDGKEVARIRLTARDFGSFPETRIMKAGSRFEVSITVPRTIEKAKKVTLKRGKVDD